MIGFIGEINSSTLEECVQLNNTIDFSLVNFPYTEIKILYQIIFHVNTNYTNSYKSKIAYIKSFVTNETLYKAENFNLKNFDNTYK